MITLASVALACSPQSTGEAPPAQSVAQPAPLPEPVPTPQPPAAPPRQQPVPFIALGSAPPVGTPNEYDAMMEQVSAEFSLANDPLEMTMASFWRIGDWARVGAQSHVPGRRDGAGHMHEYNTLFRKIDGAWKLIRTECSEDSDACNESQTLASFKKRLPEAPLELAPQPPATKTKPKPAVHGRFGETSFFMTIDELAKLVPLAKGETFKIVEIGRDATSSYHVVALLGDEPLHKHATHDLMVVLLEGQGEMLIGHGYTAIGPHSIVHVPRGIVHSMRNTAKAPLVGYAVFTPPFDGKDRVPTPEL